jgi:hypothetical protein
MPLELSDCQFTGPALPEPFVKFELENELTKLKLLPKTTGIEGKELKEDWQAYRRHLAQLAVRGGPLRVRNQAIEPLCQRLGYTDEIVSGDEVETREGRESGGHLLTGPDGTKLRFWATDLDEDLDAPAKRGQAYRFSHLRIAQRVLLASGERVGLLTNGVELRLLISDPARPDSQVVFSLDPAWKGSRDVPDSFRLLLALATPDGVKAIPELVDKARLQQARVTKDLRDQARQAVQRFIQEVLDHPDNAHWLSEQTDREALARALWHEGLKIVYRLLFILKLETSDDPARSFTFASTSLWRNTFSPSMALARFAPKVLYDGAETGGLLEHGLRGLFRMFHEGVECTELNVKPLGGALFGVDATPVLSQLRWGERAVAHLLDQLLWTTPKKKSGVRERVHYGPLDVEDLGRVYEALLELEPGMASEPMCRLRRQKLEVVVPLAQGDKYRPATPTVVGDDGQDVEDQEEDEVADEEDEAPKRGKKTTVQWIEEISPGRFYLRVGLGRKATGSFYTPHSFVRFLVQETLGPQVAERSPPDDPQPCEILKLRVLDPAMGSGHFLVEACRFLGHHLYEAVRLCDEKATAAERRAELAKRKEDREPALAESQKFRQRIIDLPDPDDEIVRYLPSRSVEGEQSGVSQRKAEALCRRMIAVHCLYGVDKNPLAVELAKLALWLESHAEGMPLTFLDHRLVVGDSLTGPFWERLLTWPSKPDEKLEGVVFRGLENRFRSALFDALRHVKRLEASVGVTLAEVAEKQTAKADLDDALLPFRVAAAAWAGGVMLGANKCDDVAYVELLQTIATTHELPQRFTPKDDTRGSNVPDRAARLAAEPSRPYGVSPSTESPAVRRSSSVLQNMIARGLGVDGIPNEGAALAALVKSGRCSPALSYDLTYPEVFYPNGIPFGRQGFDAVLGNPPWDRVRPFKKEFLATYDFAILNAPTARESSSVESRLLADEGISQGFRTYAEDFAAQGRIHDMLYNWHEVEVGGIVAGRGNSDLYIMFMERNAQLLRAKGLTGVVVPYGFHANEGATGIRQLYLDRMILRTCYSFENHRKLFEIDSRVRFALVVAEAGGITTQFSCAFFLHEDEWLFSDRNQRPPLWYSRDFVRHTGSVYLTFVELKSRSDLEVAETCFGAAESFGAICERKGIRIGRECDMTRDAWRFVATEDVLPPNDDPRQPQVLQQLIAKGYLLLHEGKTFRQYDDLWGDRPRYLVPIHQLADRPNYLIHARFYRLAHRQIAGPGDENISIWAMHAPGATHGNSCPVEGRTERPNYVALAVLAIANSTVFDFLLGLRVRANVLGFMRDSQPLPSLESWFFLAHGSLRLTCNHSGYAPLWREQLDREWREPGKPPFTWPVLAGDDERWAVRAAIDAVVADAYGLTRDQYAHVLSTFSHASYRKAPELCLARFDELKQLGLDKFTRQYDPYWDIPLNENLPQPVIDLPLPAEAAGSPPSGTPDEALALAAESEGAYRLTGAPKAKRKGRKRN